SSIKSAMRCAQFSNSGVVTMNNGHVDTQEQRPLEDVARDFTKALAEMRAHPECPELLAEKIDDLCIDMECEFNNEWLPIDHLPRLILLGRKYEQFMARMRAKDEQPTQYQMAADAIPAAALNGSR